MLLLTNIVLSDVTSCADNILLTCCCPVRKLLLRQRLRTKVTLPHEADFVQTSEAAKSVIYSKNFHHRIVISSKKWHKMSKTLIKNVHLPTNWPPTATCIRNFQTAFVTHTRSRCQAFCALFTACQRATIVFQNFSVLKLSHTHTIVKYCLSWWVFT